MSQENLTETPVDIVDYLNSTGLFDVKPVGPDTISAISVMGDKEKLAGNVLRRLCKLGGEACAKTCVLQQGDMDAMKEIMATAQSNIDRRCADENLSQVVNQLGVMPENVLMVGVTADNIGFADEMDAISEKYPYAINPKTGVKELAGFNAFFAKEGITVGGDEVSVLGRRLADCGDINLEFIDKDGKKVMGFMHMTKPNLFEPGSHPKPEKEFEYDSQKVGSFEYFLRTAMDHYEADISSVQVRIAAAIKAENFSYVFDENDKLDQNFPGWKELGLVINKSNPDWQPGEPVAGDTLNMDFRKMLEWQIDQIEELKPDQVNWQDAIDPGDTESKHASNARGKKDQDKDGRDAYFTAWASKLEA